jgi:hypothetical protein
MGIVLPKPDRIVCRYSSQNKECLGEKCVFFSGT